jgi:transcriptional regulator with XRE-family HTH domain
VGFYENLHNACEMQGLKISNVVIEVGEKLGSLNGWKKGSMPNSKAVIALALRLNVSADYLLDLPIKHITSAELSENESILLSFFRECSENSQNILLDLAEHYSKQDATAKEKEKISV